MAKACPTTGKGIENPLQQHGKRFAGAWQKHGTYMGYTSHRHGKGMATTWQETSPHTLTHTRLNHGTTAYFKSNGKDMEPTLIHECKATLTRRCDSPRGEDASEALPTHFESIVENTTGIVAQ
jgi:hypothetical protein